ncbi:MAG: transcriptional repressor [Actinomycetota bacterium]|nr:transcriptional repressor [Actinomycetota bacterium]
MSQQDPEQIVAELRQRGLRMTPQRRAIVAEALSAEGHISPAALARKIEERVPGCNTSTVYRTLALLDELGVLAHTHFEGGVEYHRAEEAGHVHLTCSLCEGSLSLSRRDVEPLQELLQERHGFQADLTHFEITGICRSCRSSRATAAAGKREGPQLTSSRAAYQGEPARPGLPTKKRPRS